MSGVERVAVEAGEAGARLDRWFKRRYPGVSHGALEKLLRTGQVRVDGARAKAGQRLETGQEVRVPPLGEGRRPTLETGRGPVSPADAALIRSLVIHDDDQVIVLNKPHGLAVQGGAKTRRHVDAMTPALVPAGAEAPRLAHRLDRDTSGVLALGKTPAATAALAKGFASRRAQKTYWAVVRGAPTPRAGLIKGFLRKEAGRSGRERMVAARHGQEDAVYARTRYAVIAQAGARAAWVGLRPETGRTHQLRVHMAMLGTSIIGDHKYVCDHETPGGLEDKLHLHARRLVVPHPAGGLLDVTAEPPAHLRHAFDALGFDAALGDAVEWPEAGGS